MVADGEELVGGPTAVDINPGRASNCPYVCFLSLSVACNKHGFPYNTLEIIRLECKRTGKFGDPKHIKTRKLHI